MAGNGQRRDWQMAFFLKTKVWQTGALEWWGHIDGQDFFLGSREFPLPPEEGDEWTVRSTGDHFQVVDSEIRYLGRKEIPPQLW
jgi:hypothetical protein